MRACVRVVCGSPRQNPKKPTSILPRTLTTPSRLSYNTKMQAIRAIRRSNAAMVRCIRQPRMEAVMRAFSALPAHEVMPMPALSPTMESGIISKWNVAPGDVVTAGQAIAEIETDKASMTLEAMDDNLIAKLLVEEGADVKVGHPILVLCEEGEELEGFVDFVAAAPAAAAATPEPVAAPVAAPPAPVAAAPSAAPPVAAAVPVQAAAATTSDHGILAIASVRTMWTRKNGGPLAAGMAIDQHAYVAKYGRGLHKPLPLANKK